MKKILAILVMMLMCVGMNAQNVTYSKDLVNSAKWGNVQAMYDLSLCYRMGKGVKRSYKSAIYWLKKAAKKGNDKAMDKLGTFYQHGYCGLSKDYSKALDWYKKAAARGNNIALIRLAECYQKGDCGLPKNQSKADVLYYAEKKVRDGDKQKAIDLIYQVFYGKDEIELYQSIDLTASNDKSNYSANNSANNIPNLNNYSNTSVASNKKAIEPAIMEIVPGSIVFTDASGNNAIDANEICMIKLKIRNKGKGYGKGCVLEVSTIAKGVSIRSKGLSTIDPGASVDVEIPITTNMNTIEGKANFAIWVSEPNGFGTNPTNLTVDTHAFVQPLLKVVDYAVSNDAGGKLKKVEPFDLTFMLQNTKYGKAENVSLSIELPQNVFMMKGESTHYIGSMPSGDKRTISYTLIANNNYSSETIPVKINISEKYGKYAESRTINLAMNQQMTQSKNVVIKGVNNSPQGNIEIAQIEGKMQLSDVDQNIPHNATTEENTFAVIIANENYMQESKVTFALNDGKMFGLYCEEVLGLPKENIRIFNDATLNQIRGGVNWLKKVAEAYKGEANLIFYYAGHGVPDESTKDAYMLPVDGYGNDLVTAYKMEDLYSKLSSCPNKQTLVFLDACFSGKQRSGEEMATARAVGISTRKAAPKGNMVVFSAAQGDETAYPYKEKQHGMFTYYLLKKLQQSRGNVTLGELSSYIKDNVMRKSVVTNTKSQTPTVQPSSSMMNSWRNIKL